MIFKKEISADEDTWNKMKLIKEWKKTIWCSMISKIVNQQINYNFADKLLNRFKENPKILSQWTLYCRRLQYDRYADALP